ncbi:alpha/beta fold hydrolase [Aliiglaciecola sp. LCG003]|uniref:esterase/lipase family protein n=1 Tax=Aliiglaciecola sp. LCG003 TaxID=3053655 RepID=UPI002572D59D|nr:alpha/beta fold hydrolase [Aliiglaciecola sp. LCG003]WJG08159.1 hypothetical protein QR722_12500 [Aliiglaciecola sp. LCG003]
MSDLYQQDQKVQKPMSNLQSANRLLVDAIVSMTDIVESMHHRISPMSRITQSPAKERTSGVTGLVYKSIRGLTELVGKGIDVPLGVISQSLGQKELAPSGAALVSALNGVLGDHLAERQSPLAIPMMFKQDGKQLDQSALMDAINKSKGKLVIMVHGLCMNDLQWQQGEHNHGKALADDLGHAAVYLHYNSGQHVSENGKTFSHMLEKIVLQANAMDASLQLDISIVAHSMGGLVSRSAYHHAKILGHAWPDYFKNLIFLGTPHHGAPLEKAGSWLDMLLDIHAYASPLSRLTKIRSAGINDLRHGNIVETDWQARTRFDFSSDKRTPMALPDNVKCYAVATTISANSSRITEQMVGDGLVPLDSALGKHENKTFTLQFPRTHQWIGRDISHMQLLSDPDIYVAIRHWLAIE